MPEFTCFKCGDGNTPLYCLNCANEQLRKDRDEARQERNQALKEAKVWEARHDGALNERDEAQALNKQLGEFIKPTIGLLKSRCPGLTWVCECAFHKEAARLEAALKDL